MFVFSYLTLSSYCRTSIWYVQYAGSQPRHSLCKIHSASWTTDHAFHSSFFFCICLIPTPTLLYSRFHLRWYVLHLTEKLPHPHLRGLIKTKTSHSFRSGFSDFPTRSRSFTLSSYLRSLYIIQTSCHSFYPFDRISHLSTLTGFDHLKGRR